MKKPKPSAYDRKHAKDPGKHWRVQSDTDGFDEIVVDHWLHAERLNKRTWFVRVGDNRMWIRIPADGSEPFVYHEGLGDMAKVKR